MLSKRFPYAIYYKLDGATVSVIWRVLDLRSNPMKIRQALKAGRSSGS